MNDEHVEKVIDDLYEELAQRLGISREQAETAMLDAFAQVIYDPRFGDLLLERLQERIKN